MRPILRVLSIFFMLAGSSFAVEVFDGYCQQGGQTVTTNGAASTTKVQQSYPSCTVAVYLTGTSTLATIYSDSASTPKANPFTAATNSYWFFYIAPAIHFDVTISGGGLASPITHSYYVVSNATSGILSLNGLTGTTQTFATGTAGTDFAISSSGSMHTFNIPTASANNRGLLSSANWNTFNGKESVLTFNSPLSRSTNTISLGTVAIANGGTGATTQTTGFNALSPLTTKGDLITHNGTNNIRRAVGANGTCLVADSAQASGLNWGTCFTSLPISVSNGGTGVSTLTGVPVASGTSAFSAVAASSDLMELRRKANQTSTTYEFYQPAPLTASDFDFPAQAPGGTLTGGVGASSTLTPCPLGVNGADSAHRVYISAGTGTAEAVLITGGSCTSGAASGTLTYTPANNHSGAWTISSATNGLEEAICYAPSSVNGTTVNIYGTLTLNGNLSYCGKTNIAIVLTNGSTIAGAGTVPAAAAGTFIIDQRHGIMFANLGSTLASAATVAPVSGIFHISGTMAIDTFTVPSNFRYGCFRAIADAAWTTTVAGNIGKAITAVANVVYEFCYDGTAWYPTGA